MFKRNNIFKCDGFTLIELLVVVLILSIFLTIAKPVLTDYIADCKLTAAAILLQEDIRFFCQQALVEERGDIYLRFHQDKYRFYDGNIASWQKEVVLPGGIEIAYTNFSHITFISIRGILVTGGHVVLHSTGTDKFKYVIVAPVTCRVRISDSPPT